jgi:protein-S-isoprenylcysteine O-methyltransferase Ste14
MKTTNTKLGKILYGSLFIIIIPIVLVFWAKLTEPIITYNAIKNQSLGLVISMIGGILLIWGMLALMKFGKGLPMNAYPPKYFVKKGPYRWFRHPIYVGFGVLLFGIAITIGSASLLWLVTPITILGMIALVLGYEKISLKFRFPEEKIKTYLDIAERDSSLPDIRDYFSAIIWVLLTLLCGNYLIGHLEGDSLPLFSNPWEIQPAFLETPIYYLSWLFILAAPLVFRKKNQIRDWTITALIGLALSVSLALLWPELGAQYLSSDLLLTGHKLSIIHIVKAIPVFLILVSLRAYFRYFKKFAIILGLLGILLCIYQFSISRSAILHAGTSIIIYFIAANYSRIWIFLKEFAEIIANSWKEWTYGPIRIINHGFYVGFGSFLGLLLSGWLAGPNYAWAILIFALIVIIFSALWAQLIEGSEKLKRPFGYYGALVGIIFAGPIVWLMGYNIWVIIGVVSVVMPWVQAIGRLRCLINGCCHGSPTPNPRIGIRYFHYRSRVCGISGLKGELLHPTPLYSILWLFIVGFILLALWLNHFAYPFIFGLYLILTSLGRFVEEAYRGEVQTPIQYGLRLYQWTAIISLIIGIIMTVIPAPLTEVYPQIVGETIFAAIIGGLFTFFVMGVDFPNSNARFSRLV